MIDVAGPLMYVCGVDHRLRWVGGRNVYKHAAGVRCDDKTVRCVPSRNGKPIKQ